MDNFRYDINGLRAYAVILVVLFHFDILGFSAGFIGVDIFFVISGFLMTKIISEKILANKFSLISFMIARSVRILPALLTVTLFVFFIGYFFLEPESYKKYATYAGSSILFLSNILYWKKTGDYFSTNAHDIPLLHTWSLSVEWQFYIVFPIILVLITKWKINKSTNQSIKVIVVSLLIISFLISYFVTPKDQTFSFFMLPTRAWEMLSGGLVYLFFNKKNIYGKYISILGLFFIIAGLFIIKPDTLWPGYMALIPVIGSMLIIIGRNEESILYKNYFIQSFGDWSYSIYLWHWPVIFFINYLDIKNSYTIIVGIIISFVLGMISFNIIEKPTRKYFNNLKPLKTLFLILAPLTFLFILYSLLYYKQGFEYRASDNYISKTENLKMPRSKDGWCFYGFDGDSNLKYGDKNSQTCVLGSFEKDAKKVILFGDSFAGQYAPFWDIIGKKINLSINVVTTNACSITLDDSYRWDKSSGAYKQCLLNRKYFEKNLKKYDFIILANDWSSIIHSVDFKKFEILTNEMLDTQKVIIMDIPFLFDKNISYEYRKKLWLNKDFKIQKYIVNSKNMDQSLVEKKLLSIVNKRKNYFFMSNHDLFDRKQVTKDNIPYSLDGSHISVYGSLESAYFFEKGPRYQDLQSFIR